MGLRARENKLKFQYGHGVMEMEISKVQLVSDMNVVFNGGLIVFGCWITNLRIWEANNPTLRLFKWATLNSHCDGQKPKRILKTKFKSAYKLLIIFVILMEMEIEPLGYQNFNFFHILLHHCELKILIISMKL